MNIRFSVCQMLTTILIACYIFHQCDGKILRYRDKFIGRFTLVDSDQRIKVNCIRNITKATKPQECCNKCLKEKMCQSFNRHRDKGSCELLAISKFNETGLLRRDTGWVHYETDDDEQNVGPLCTQLSPCKSYQVCEDTLEGSSGYRCCCRDGFEGEKCQAYRGIGTKKSNPAASCDLLLLKFKNISDGDYWFSGKQKEERCERKVDGSYNQWSQWSHCNFTEGKCGTQTRSRSCTNPHPKGGGRSCEHIGPNYEIRKCQCLPGCSHSFFHDKQHAFKEKILFGIFEKVLVEFKVKFMIKLDFEKLQNATYYNILKLTQIDSTYPKYGGRHPAVYLRWIRKDGSKPYINICSSYRDIPNRAEIFCYNLRRKKETFDEKWIALELVQKKNSDGKYIFEIIYDGIKDRKQKIEVAREVRNVKLYINHNKNLKQGHIKQLHIEAMLIILRGFDVDHITYETGRYQKKEDLAQHAKF